MAYKSYADIIIDISHENLDKTYQYAVPDNLASSAVIGAPVVCRSARKQDHKGIYRGAFKRTED